LNTVRSRPSPDELRELYTVEGHSMAAIGDRYGYCAGSVLKWLRRADIPTRRHGVARELAEQRDTA
jgi:transposase